MSEKEDFQKQLVREEEMSEKEDFKKQLVREEEMSEKEDIKGDKEVKVKEYRRKCWKGRGYWSE